MRVDATVHAGRWIEEPAGEYPAAMLGLGPGIIAIAAAMVIVIVGNAVYVWRVLSGSGRGS